MWRKCVVRLVILNHTRFFLLNAIINNICTRTRLIQNISINILILSKSVYNFTIKDQRNSYRLSKNTFVILAHI